MVSAASCAASASPTPSLRERTTRRRCSSNTAWRRKTSWIARGRPSVARTVPRRYPPQPPLPANMRQSEHPPHLHDKDRGSKTITVADASPPLTLGWLGTGKMGGAMAARLLGAGHQLTVWNRTGGKTDALAAAGASVVASIAGLAGLDVVFIM